MSSPTTCPKCAARDWIRVPGRKVSGFPSVQVSAYRVVPLVRYVCGGCGFVEQWVESQADIGRIKKKYGSRA